MSPPGKPAVEIAGVSRTFPGVRGGAPTVALTPITTDVAENDFVTILGPSGCGKSTQQRVAIARALANDPAILLLDEPFGALDNQTRGLMQELLLQIWEADRKTVLFVTHDIEEAIFLASRCLVMTARPGRIKADVPIPLAHPRHYRMKAEPDFLDLKMRLTEEIREEAKKVA